MEVNVGKAMTTCDMCGALAMNTLTLCSECKDHVEHLEHELSFLPEDQFDDDEDDDHFEDEDQYEEGWL